MRIMAEISNDKALGQLFDSSGDVYVLLASKIFNKRSETVTAQERNQAKTICLGKCNRGPVDTLWMVT
jgi:DNA polymerase I-like protein with 3'-5' exonuclease and polymerase domains